LHLAFFNYNDAELCVIKSWFCRCKLLKIFTRIPNIIFWQNTSWKIMNSYPNIGSDEQNWQNSSETQNATAAPPATMIMYRQETMTTTTTNLMLNYSNNHMNDLGDGLLQSTSAEQDNPWSFLHDGEVFWKFTMNDRKKVVYTDFLYI